MENWKIQLVVVTFCVLVQTSKGSASGVEDERRLSRHWQYEPAVDSSPIDSLMKRSKALRFYGLMGKRAVTKKPFQVKRRNMGVAFMDLMGQRVSSGESVSGVNPSAATRETRHPQGPSQQGSLKEWMQFLY
ncbi:uncharacterized protein si:ch211-131k2.2 [Poeciliopsis prolifica]|uniref:uncharacterized protein si:ch211-131k2.2 n=1 Tax=Poeciliopsis prolifica TaxID=188132 RepID=UPI002413CF38|nr:uncharacterized protein si:ch211-131k2.2 [Poeciliopsis prolifica]